MAASIFAVQDDIPSSLKTQPSSEILKYFSGLSTSSFPLCSTPVQPILHTVGPQPLAPSLQNCFLKVPAPMPCSAGRCSEWCVRRSLAEVLETEAWDEGSNDSTKELNLLGMVQPLIRVGLKGKSTPCSPSMKTASLQNKLPVQAQVSRRGASAFHHAMASPAEQETQSIQAPSSPREEVNFWFCSKNKGIKTLGNNAPHLPLSPPGRVPA